MDGETSHTVNLDPWCTRVPIPESDRSTDEASSNMKTYWSGND